MSPLDRCRQAAVIVLVAACLLVAPGIASARFSVPAPPAPTLKVSSAQMVAPSNVVGSYLCNPPGADSLQVTIASFTDAGPGADSYIYTMTSDNGASTVARSAARSQVLSDFSPVDRGSVVWTITVQTVLASWTSPTWSATVECQKKRTTSGP